MNKETLVEELKRIKRELIEESTKSNFFDESKADEAMYHIVELLNNYQQETKDESWHTTMAFFLTLEQVKEEIIKKLQSSNEVTPDLLNKISGSLCSCKYSTVWCQKFGNQYFSICKQTVIGLIAQLLKEYDPQNYDEYKKQAIEKLKGIIIDTDDLDGTFEELCTFCDGFERDTGDRRLVYFFNNNFLGTDEVRNEIQDLLDFDTLCPDDLAEIKRRMQLGMFISIYYQKLADNSYIDLNDEGLKWCKERLLQLLEDKDDETRTD